jgi:hypothetical protein
VPPPHQSSRGPPPHRLLHKLDTTHTGAPKVHLAAVN